MSVTRAAYNASEEEEEELARAIALSLEQSEEILDTSAASASFAAVPGAISGEDINTSVEGASAEDDEDAELAMALELSLGTTSVSSNTKDNTPDSVGTSGGNELPGGLTASNVQSVHEALFLQSLGNDLRTGNTDEFLLKATTVIERGYGGNVKLLVITSRLLKTRYTMFKKSVDLERALAFQKQAIRLTPVSHLDYALRLRDLGLLYTTRFESSSDVADEDESLRLQQEAVTSFPAAHPEMPSTLSFLGASLRSRFQRARNLTDLNACITTYQQAASLFPDAHPIKSAVLDTLGESLRVRFELTGNLEDLNQSVTAHRGAVSIMPDSHPSKPRYLNNLAAAFSRRLDRAGDLSDANQAISVLQNAVSVAPDTHPDTPEQLCNLGRLLTHRFELGGDIQDVDEAIRILRRGIISVDNGHPAKHMCLGNVGVALLRRSERTGEATDLNESISALRQALRHTPGGDSEELTHRDNLGVSLIRRFEQEGNITDLDEAIRVLRQASLLPLIYPDRPSCYNNLGKALMRRFERRGSILDLDQAISTLQQAATMTPDGHPHKPTCFSNLGNAFLRRFEYAGVILDLDQAISALQDAVILTPDTFHEKPAYLNNLGAALMHRFDQTKDLVSLDQALPHLQKAIVLSPDGLFDKPRHVDNLGGLFSRRFEYTRHLPDIDQAVSMRQEAVALSPRDHPQKHGFLTNLSISHLHRFICEGDLLDVNEAISAGQQAVPLVPDGHPSRPWCLNNLAALFIARSEKLQDPADRLTAIDLYRQSATSLTGKPTFRFQAAYSWGQQLSKAPDTADSSQLESLKAYSVMMNLVSQVVWLGRTIHQRYHDIGFLSTAVNEAAATACKLGNHELALEWLEQGRSIIWGQILQLRTPVDQLHSVNPDLASQLREVAKDLENAGSSSLMETTGLLKQESLEETAQAHRRLALRWEELLKQARSTPGFEDFLQPRKLSSFASVASNHPVVIINTHRTRCDALILQPESDSVRHVALQISYETISNGQQALDRCLERAGVRQRGLQSSGGQDGSTNIMSNLLTILWLNIVEPVLSNLGMIVDEPHELLPRITWCLTGSLAFLPLHAAGNYRGKDVHARIFNYAISSYTTSLTALLETTPKSEGIKTFGNSILAITQANSIGQSRLPGATEEVNQLEQQITQTSHSLERLDGPAATVAVVSQDMDKHEAIHFACHAVQDAEDPTKSGFILHDGRLQLGSIMSKQLPNAHLAYLSACQTASGESRLPEEAIHLAAGMFVAGYPSVVATMWSIRDIDAPRVASSFYRHILKDDYADIAGALHLAIAELRKEVGEMDFVSWSPFVHFGH